MMGDNETIVDIIAEMRFHGQQNIDAEKDKPEYGILTVEGRIAQNYADRLEAARKREKAAIEADALAVGGMVEASRKRELLSKTRENDNSGAAVYNSDNSGDCAKMREALQQAKVAILAARKKMGVDNPIILEIIDAALAAPPRNCDVGTVKEQFERWQAFCGRHDPVCKGCPCDGPECSFAFCFAKWAQMPYEDGETGGGSHGSRNGERKAQLAGVAREAVRR